MGIDTWALCKGQGGGYAPHLGPVSQGGQGGIDLLELVDLREPRKDACMACIKIARARARELKREASG